MATSHGPPRGEYLAEAARRREEPAALTVHQLTRLLDLSRALDRAREQADVATTATELGRALTGASAAQVAWLRDGGRLAVLADAVGAAPASLFRTPAAIRSGAPEHDVIRRGVPIWIGTRGEAAERWPHVSLDALTGGRDGASWALLPLVADGETSGVLTLAFDEGREFDAPTRAFLGEVAAACGNALARGRLFTEERARANASEEARAASEVRQRRSEQQVADRTHLYERERFARARAEAETVAAVHAADDLERVQPLTAALFDADSAQDVVAALMEHGPDGFGAVGLELTRRGADGGVRAPSERGTPEAEVLRSGAPLWLDATDLAARFPESSEALLARDAGSWLGVPVPGGDRIDAVLSVAFPRARAFTRGDRARLAVLANECASVLARCTARDAGAAAQARTDRAPAARPPGAFLVQYVEAGVDGPAGRILGVFSSEASAREASRELGRRPSLVVQASITSWTLDEAGAPRTSVEVEL